MIKANSSGVWTFSIVSVQFLRQLFWAIIWAPSSEFVSSSIPSWQTLTAHAQTFREARDLAFCLKVPLDSLLVWASSEGSGETARMRRLAWTFAARIGYKYQIRLTRSIWQNQQNGMCAQQMPSLIRVFAVRIKKVWVLSYPVSTQQILWSDWVDAQADLRLRWVHSHFVGFVVRLVICLVYLHWQPLCWLLVYIGRFAVCLSEGQWGSKQGDQTQARELGKWLAEG